MSLLEVNVLLHMLNVNNLFQNLLVPIVLAEMQAVPRLQLHGRKVQR